MAARLGPRGLTDVLMIQRVTRELEQEALRQYVTNPDNIVLIMKRLFRPHLENLAPNPPSTLVCPPDWCIDDGLCSVCPPDFKVKRLKPNAARISQGPLVAKGRRRQAAKDRGRAGDRPRT